jgi:hypothetical protein
VDRGERVTRIVAVFDSPRAVERAIEASEAAGWRTLTVCSPAFDARLLQLVGATRSPVAAWALAGGLAGVVCGFLLTIGTVRQWPGLIVGGKPLIALPSFLVIVFELAVLFASIGAVLSFLVASKRARRTASAACDDTTTDASFALLIEVSAASANTDQRLKTMGALRWQHL